ncbi:non-ribosomal peptide synthetase [Nocardia sp. A7]|uniref:non-ribosomal peptide synthetase n=1 Tax=Nocardia sp. A7 TaxID=2789274 RepID=UPI00397E2E48
MSGTLVDLLTALHASERTITFDTGKTLAHRDVPAAAGDIALRLRELGAGPGDVVGLLMPTCPAWVTGFFGAISTGAAVTGLPLPPIAPAAAVAQLATIVQTGEVRYLLTAGIGTEVGKALAERIPTLRVIDLDTPTSHSGSCPPAVTVAPDALAVVQFSSGSTARPKGVRLTHAQFLYGVAALVDHAEVTTDDVLVQWVPLFHDMGLVSLMTSLLVPYDAHLFSAKTFITDTADLLRYIAQVGGSIVCGPNFSFDRFLGAAAEAFGADTTDAPLARWRLAINGAEQVRPHTVREFARVFGPLGVPVSTMSPCYGMAEATLAVTIPRPGCVPRVLTVDRNALVPGQPYRVVAADAPNAREIVGVGVPVPGISLRIADIDGTVLPDGCVGEIHIHGPAVTSGYLGADGSQIVDGWLRTGDLGLIESGELVIVGRVKEMIIVAGRNFFPDDVEEAARTTAGVYKGHCVAVADSAAERMIVVAESEARPGSAAADAVITQIRRAVSGTLALSAVTVLLVAPKSLPRTTSGKWQRALIAEHVRRELADRRPAEITRVLRAELARRFACRVDDIDLAAPITELPGADSVLVLETLVACERRWRVRLDEDALAHVHTGADLRDLFLHALGSSAVAPG